MRTVWRLAPDAGEVNLEDQLAALSGVPALEPASDLAFEVCDAVGRALFRDPFARARPDLLALASWLRRANLVEVARSLGDDPKRVARGLAFHVTPANVDTIAMYSLALSMLAGNRNIVRVSSRAGEAMERICIALDAALAPAHLAPLRAGTAVLSWDHDSDATAVCSGACDVRLVWGGDETVAALRALPLRPGANDVAFFDRFSLAAIRTDAWLAAGERERNELARRLYNDSYWFDQQGCSSPRLVVWCGSQPLPVGAAVDVASADLFSRLDEQLRAHGYELPLGAVTSKLAWLAGAAIDRPLRSVRTWSNELCVLRLDTLADLDRSHPGGGTFLEASVDRLTDLAEWVSVRDQTLAVYGFDHEELSQFVHAAAGRGVDRIVALGEALHFEHRWDGFNMLAELTKQVVISAGAARPVIGVAS